MEDLINKWETMRALQGINPVAKLMDGDFVIRISEVENVLEHMTLGQPDTTTHDSIPTETGKNDGDGTSGDCISRKAAIDCLNNVSFDCSMDQEVVENELLKLPSVQPEQRWIPVTEILPENDDKVLITHSHGVSMAWWNGRYWTGSMIRKYKTVTAWMPLPEAYQEGGEADE